VRQAVTTGPDVRTARANLDKAGANLAAVRADPTTLVTGLTSAEQGFESAQAALRGARLSVMQTVVNQFTALYETQERIELGAAQVNLSDRNVRIAQARLAARNATQLDV
ncbi:TolC family protein, partial [Deinococcus pimensis]|uniref:TolC family protein n=1 Tax=Deinococcus pimensis TaxID=309888 RepID=UPI00146FA9BE